MQISLSILKTSLLPILIPEGVVSVISFEACHLLDNQRNYNLSLWINTAKDLLWMLLPPKLFIIFLFNALNYSWWIKIFISINSEKKWILTRRKTPTQPLSLSLFSLITTWLIISRHQSTATLWTARHHISYSFWNLLTNKHTFSPPLSRQHWSHFLRSVAIGTSAIRKLI